MISRDNKQSNSIFAEMVSIMDSKEHKEMFAPLSAEAASPFEDAAKKELEKPKKDMPWEAPGGGKDDLPMSPDKKPEKKAGAFDEAAAPLLATPDDEMQEKLKHFDYTGKGNVETPSKSVNVPEPPDFIFEEDTITATPPVQKTMTPEVRPAELGTSPFDPSKQVPGPVSAPTAALVEELVKMANYFGQNNMLKSEAITDMLIESLLESK